MTKQSLPRRLAAFSLLASSFAFATPAFAHHMMGGKLPSTFGEGFLSGLGHPVIGLDHLAFIVAAGVIAGAAGLGLWMPAVFVAASIFGVFVFTRLRISRPDSNWPAVSRIKYA